jgi:hypothetical protein
MAGIRLENMGHLDHIAIKTNMNSLFFQENEGVNPLELRERPEGRERTSRPARLRLKKRPCSKMEPRGEPVPARRSAFRHAGVVPKNHTHLRQGFWGSSAGKRNPLKHDRSITESGSFRSYAFLYGQGRDLLRRRMEQGFIGGGEANIPYELLFFSHHHLLLDELSCQYAVPIDHFSFKFLKRSPNVPSCPLLFSFSRNFL